MTTEFGFESVDTLKVRDAKDVEAVVRAAIAGEQPLEIIGHGTKRAIGHPMATNAVLDLSALNAVTAYEPNELIITVQAGVPLADLHAPIDSQKHQFPFQPMDTCKLLAGSWGTLAVMTEVTLKVMPKPESERTLMLAGLDDVTANRAMTMALGSPFDVSGAAHLPNSAFRPATGALAGFAAQGRAVT